MKSEPHSQHSQSVFSCEGIVLSVGRGSSADVLGSHTEYSAARDFSVRTEVLFSQAPRVPLMEKTPKRLRGLRYFCVECVKDCPLQLRPFVPAGVMEQSKVYF